jgi:hypothetical protein
MSVLHGIDDVDPSGVLSGVRRDLHECLLACDDTLFELVDALPCTDGPVRTLVELSLAPEHQK